MKKLIVIEKLDNLFISREGELQNNYKGASHPVTAPEKAFSIVKNFGAVNLTYSTEQIGYTQKGNPKYRVTFLKVEEPNYFIHEMEKEKVTISVPMCGQRPIEKEVHRSLICPEKLREYRLSKIRDHRHFSNKKDCPDTQKQEGIFEMGVAQIRFKSDMVYTYNKSYPSSVQGWEPKDKTKPGYSFPSLEHEKAHNMGKYRDGFISYSELYDIQESETVGEVTLSYYNESVGRIKGDFENASKPKIRVIKSRLKDENMKIVFPENINGMTIVFDA